jgi:putative phosphoribosyl transferase
MIFRDRIEAGRRLGRELRSTYGNNPDAVALGLPRGGVPVAYEVAQILDIPLDVLLVRKLGVPGHSELAMGAIASGDVRYLNPQIVRSLRLSRGAIETVAEAETRELHRREQLYRGDRPPLNVTDKIAIIIDDGLATGATMRVAIQALRQQQPREIVVAVPVAAVETCDELQDVADRVFCTETPHPFLSVGLWYNNFSQTSDQEVCQLLKEKCPA